MRKDIYNWLRRAILTGFLLGYALMPKEAKAEVKDATGFDYNKHQLIWDPDPWQSHLYQVVNGGTEEEVGYVNAYGTGIKNEGHNPEDVVLYYLRNYDTSNGLWSGNSDTIRVVFQDKWSNINRFGADTDRDGKVGMTDVFNGIWNYGTTITNENYDTTFFLIDFLPYNGPGQWSGNGIMNIEDLTGIIQAYGTEYDTTGNVLWKPNMTSQTDELEALKDEPQVLQAHEDGMTIHGDTLIIPLRLSENLKGEDFYGVELKDMQFSDDYNLAGVELGEFFTADTQETYEFTKGEGVGAQYYGSKFGQAEPSPYDSIAVIAYVKAVTNDPTPSLDESGFIARGTLLSHTNGKGRIVATGKVSANSLTGTLEDELKDVKKLGLHAWPNPYMEAQHDKITISYTVKQKTNVDITMFDPTGRKERILYEGKVGRGEHKISFPLDGTSSGMHFIRLRTNYDTETWKETVIR